MRFAKLFVASIVSVGSIAVAAPRATAWTPGEQVGLSQWLSPGADLSTSGDFATDVFGDPWDFSNREDLNPTNGVGVAVASDHATYANGVLTVPTLTAAEIRLLMKWPGVLPWGRDGWANPIDAARYTHTSFRIQADASMYMAVRWWGANGQFGQIPFTVTGGGWQQFDFDLTDPANYPSPEAAAPWAGPIVRFELFRGNLVGSSANTAVNVRLDWVRLRRADASVTPVSTPIPRVLTPNEQGGADYATVVRGDPWDFSALTDVGEIHDVVGLSTASGDLTGATVANDGFIGLALGGALQTDVYRRLTLDVCYDGPMSLSGDPGGGMVGRMAWLKRDSQNWSETQDFVVFPGPDCNVITLDMTTSPPGAIHDEHSINPVGWKGIDISRLRFDLNEDPGARNFSLRNVRLADDAAFASTYPITFTDAGATNGSAEIFVTATEGAYNGTRIASGIKVTPGVNTFTWDGRSEGGQQMPNGTYWVYVVINGRNAVGVGHSSGPVRLQKPVPPTPSYYVPLTPARLLDTRTGEGGNLSALDTAVSTDLQVTGRGGVPATGVTAVVMNVTAVDPTSAGFLTASPSGEPRPFVSNVNFVPGQIVPNLVTVKVGANGRVNLFNSSGSTHVVADVVGYYTTNGRVAATGRFSALSPHRLLDTRDGVGGRLGALARDEIINLDVTGVGGVPASGVSGVALNVTVDQPTAPGFLNVWPAGAPRPNASTHNFVAGLTVANMVLAKVGDNGQVSIFNSNGSTHVVADVIGYFSAQGGAFVPTAPTRLVDTRDGLGAPGPLGNAQTAGVVVANGAPAPSSASAVVVNVTSTNSTAASYVTVWPSGVAQPLASTLNPRPGYAVPNQAYLRLGDGGALDVYNAVGSTDIVIDVFGYVTAPVG